MSRLIGLGFAVVLGVAAVQDGAPWRRDVKEARQEAQQAGKPCVIILNVDCSAS